MGPIHLFELASQNAHWLSVRQAAVARNISNVNTPGYKAVDVLPFDSVVALDSLAMTTSNPRHIGQGRIEADQISVRESNAWEIVHSGNSVTLEQQLMTANEINRTYALNRSIIRSFNQLLSLSVKG
jgi:flagellar basal-body rod protein FlgB